MEHERQREGREGMRRWREVGREGNHQQPGETEQCNLGGEGEGGGVLGCRKTAAVATKPTFTGDSFFFTTKIRSMLVSEGSFDRVSLVNICGVTFPYISRARDESSFLQGQRVNVMG